MNINAKPVDQVFWYLKKDTNSKKLDQSFKTDVVIIGGGMAGISAAQSFCQKGLRVILLEKNDCGSGASGKSTGFITPNSELDLTHLVKLYGLENAHKVWQFGTRGVGLIENNIKQFSLDCGYQKQDTLTLANNNFGMQEFKKEFETRAHLNYSTTLYDQTTVQKVIGSSKYVGGISYSDSFCIDPYSYLQQMKNILLELGVQIFQETLVTEIGDHFVKAEGYTIQADTIVLCADYQCAALGKLKNRVYHVQTCVMLSEPLTDLQIQSIFPDNPYLTWDSDLTYQYFRLTENRLLVGGGSYLTSYWPYPVHDSSLVYKKLTGYIKYKFPQLQTHFSYAWPGLIGVSKDLAPIAGRDAKLPWLYYVTAATGLHWAAALGSYSAEHVVDNRTDMDSYFSPERKFILPDFLNYIIGRPAAFGLSNLYTLKIK